MTTTGGTTATVLADAIKLAGQRRRVTGRQMQTASGHSPSDWARHMKDGDWRVGKLEALARFLGLSVPDLFAGPTHVSALIDAEARPSTPWKSDSKRGRRITVVSRRPRRSKVAA